MFSANMAWAEGRELPKPKLIAMYFYADWCGNCKALSPQIEKARTTGELDKKSILFVTMNLTDKTTIHQSILHAQVMGLGDYLKAQGSATGYLALLDANTKQEVKRFTSKDSAEVILADIEKRL